ncbi:citrate/2-methylcitrate synthase [Sciscionella marina]|uniref:citrate/2-methylcitrate synthase n=1 Tax=Sciscionella marina TaxID=508770 RepID=UPI0003773F2C|nr:citrate/2-methylcitrate synthase [Sciscionella marina]
MSENPFAWRTGIAWKNKDRIVIRGYDVNELTGNLDFGQMLFLVLRGELPNKAQGEITNALMVNLAEHAMSPSSATVRFATSGGAELNSAVAAGVSAIGRLHGTSDRPAQLFREVAARAERESIAEDEAARATVAEMRSAGERMAGFHHPQHIQDPRTVRLLELSDKLGISGRYVRIARAMQDATEAVFGRTVFLNGPGAMGCIGLDAGYEPPELKAMFIVCRSLSLSAHAIEESSREKGWRASSNADMVQPLSLEMQGPHNYDGPADRVLPDPR